MSPQDITVRTYHFGKGKIYPKQVSLLREDSLGSQMSKAQLLKRKWSEDMTRNVRMARESLRKRAKVRESARRFFALKLRKLRKWPPLGMPKAAKVTHPPRRPLNCESGPPLKTLLPPREVDPPGGGSQPGRRVNPGGGAAVAVAVAAGCDATAFGSWITPR